MEQCPRPSSDGLVAPGFMADVLTDVRADVLADVRAGIGDRAPGPGGPLAVGAMFMTLG